MTLADYLVLGGYFLMMIGIGAYCATRIKKQEDFFLGGRSFGKLLQTFAAFGAGTGSSDPINTGRTTFTGGMSGMWSVMFWLFVTPFYWITGVWYRRMRHLTLGDWFVERYESRWLGAAYSIFGVLFFMIYGSMFFSAISKTAEPMIGETITVFGTTVALKFVLIPVIAVVVVVYGIAGGLAAAYYTDLIQGLCIIGLSVMLIPIGLGKLTDDTMMNQSDSLELAILANNRDHPLLVNRAVDPTLEGNQIRSAEGVLEGQWHPIDPNGQVDDSFDVLIRKRAGADGNEVDHALVKYEPAIRRVTRKDFSRVYLTKEDDGRLAVGFTLNYGGSMRIGDLTGNNEPDKAEEFYRRLAIILDGKVFSAPTLEGRISHTGIIRGDFTKQEIDELIGNLNPDDKSGFEVMHDQLPKSFFNVVGGTAAQFSFYYLLAIVLANLTGIVVQPHFIATGGGSAKTEFNARVGLVVGNFLKRFCTLGWVLTALIAATLYADVPQLVANPDQVWGYASMQLLGPGFRGLMLACLLAALMSSVDAQMVVGAGLIVRNLYVPFLKPNAGERECLWAGRLTGVIVVAGGVFFSLARYDMLKQLELTFWFPLVFAAPFWIGMYWRRGTKHGAWVTVTYCLLFFFVIPFFGPKVFSGWRENQALMSRTPHTRTTSMEVVSKSMLRRRFTGSLNAWTEAGQGLSGEKLADHRANKPQRLSPGRILVPGPDGMQEIAAGATRLPRTTENKSVSIYWDELVPVDSEARETVVATEQIDEHTTRETLDYPAGTGLRGDGNLKLNLIFYQPFNLDLAGKSPSTLNALELVPKIVMPFLVMIIASLLTRRNSTECLDHYYAKMKTPVDPDPEQDRLKLESAYADPSTCERVKLFPNSSLEFQKPNSEDIIGFVLSVLVCFAIIGVAVWAAGIGG